MHRPILAAALVIGVGLAGMLAFAQRGPAEPRVAGEPKKAAAAEEESIRKAVQSYAASFNKADLEALMAHWSSDPEFVDESGKSTRGREAIAALFKKTFQDHKGTTLSIAVTSMRFVTPDVAVQDGIATLKPPDGTPDRGPFTCLWTKAGGKWLVARVHDLPGQAAATASPNYDKLKELDWLVGDWASEGKDTSVTFSCKWVRNHSFLMIEQTIHLKEQEAMTLTQIIGWDPLQQQIRSWLFDSHGGFGEGLWTRTGNRWAVHLAGVLSDGRRASSVATWKYIDANTCEWESGDRELDGQPMADVHIKYARQTAKK
jgi:uncharacterized protein (TIGR02246 family)